MEKTDFIKDNKGIVAIIFAFSLVVFIAILGISIDLSRAFMVRSKVTSALDAAALAGGRNITSETLSADVNSYFSLNYPSDYMGTTLSVIDIKLSADKTQLELSIDVSVPNIFMRYFNLDMINFTINNRIVRKTSGLEVALVMDNTGSLGFDPTTPPSIRDCSTLSCNNIQAVKHGGKILVDLLYGDKETIPNLYVSVVPYASMINIGNNHADWTTGLTGLNYGNIGWKGCVMARYASGNDKTDATPSTEEFVPFVWESTFGNLYYPGQNPINKPIRISNKLVIGDNNWVAGQEKEAVFPDYQNLNNAVQGPNIGCPDAMMFLTPNKSDVLNKIGYMNGINRGGTMANLGLVGGYWTLSPKWRGLPGNPTPNSIPADFNSPTAQKVIVILTDGQNEWYDWPGITETKNLTQIKAAIGSVASATLTSKLTSTELSSLNGVYRGAPGSPVGTYYPDADKTGYGRLSENHLGLTTPVTNAKAVVELNQRMADACTIIKNKGIIVYTITYGTLPATTQTLFDNCATGIDRSFNSPTKEALFTAFETIGNQLSVLRLDE